MIIMKAPNILLILTDHFRPDVLGRRTPFLDELAKSGTRFTNAYCASPLCQPSRLSVITGLLPSQHGVCGNQGGPIHPDLRDGTFMRHLQTAGYHTAMIGKHHYLDRYGVGMDVIGDGEEVMRYGFDEVFQVVDEGEHMHNDDRYTEFLRQKGWLDRYRSAYRERAEAMGDHPFQVDDSADGFIGRKGIEFAANYNRRKPFYLNLSFIGPHPPYWHPGNVTFDAEDMTPPIGAFDTLETRQTRAHYVQKCVIIDNYVKGVVGKLRERGFLENTIIIFTSDHGDNLGDYGIWDKRYFYENCCGVPLFMTGPGIPGEERGCGPKVSRALVSQLDLYPTILGLAGIEPTPDRRRAGKDILPMVRNEPGALHDAVYAELATSAMIRTGGWKMVYDPEQGGVAYLFNLAGDAGEELNLAGNPEYDGVTRDLLEKLLSHRIRITQYTQAKEEQRYQRVRAG